MNRTNFRRIVASKNLDRSSMIPNTSSTNTSALLKIALQSESRSVPNVFLDTNVLKRPPFELYYEVIKFIAKEKPCWGSLLQHSCSTQHQKVVFIIKLLSLISQITGIRFDIYIAPQNVLSGQNISASHALLQAIATSAMVSEEVMSKALKYVSNAGEANLYSIGVKTRTSITSLQAIFRGWKVRKDMRRVEQAKVSDARHQMALAAQEYEALLLRKSQVAEEILEAENRLEKENGKLIRILKLQAKSRVKPDPRQEQQDLRPQSASMLSDKKLYLPVCSVDEEFAGNIIDMRAIQLRLKHKEKIFQEREDKLKEQRRASRHKEVGLKLQEERISELADKIRKQHLLLKEKKLQFERSKACPPTPPETVARTEERVPKLNTKASKAIKDKLKAKARLLNKREANLLRMAKELKRREMQLAKREEKISVDRQDNSASTKKRRRTSGDHYDDDYDVSASASSHEESEQLSNMQAIKEEEEDASDEERTEETPRQEEMLHPLVLSASHDQPTNMPPSLVKQPTITTPGTKSSNHRRSRQDLEDCTSQSLPTRPILPQQHPQYSNHVFTFEKNKTESDLADHDDAQLRCALLNLRELL